MSLHLIKTVAAFEMRTLLRSWFFRIFAGGAILGLGIFNTAANIASSGAPIIYRALPSSVPYFNLIILNLGQAIVAVFLGSEFLKQDRKNDTVEVIYARSMTNSAYIIGKTLGILAVFMTLNIIILSMGIGLSFISNAATQNIPAYFAYILLISIPTLVFILGLSFFAMVTLKNQAITFIILTGYIALTVFYLNKKFFHLFDYIAYQVPMLYSSITGFSSPLEIILHRGIYLVIGIALIAFTISRLKRLPQSRGDSFYSLIAGFVFILLASGMIYKYIDLNTSVRGYRDSLVKLNNQYNNYNVAVTDSCHIDIQHKGKSIKVDAVLHIHNANGVPIDTLVYHLNPSLQINKVEFNGGTAEFQRELHIVRILPKETLAAGQFAKVRFQYEGKINDKVAFADMKNEEFTENPVFEVFRLDKRFAFIQKNFVCLTSESQWYPMSGAGYSTDSPARVNAEFINFRLKVSTSPDLVVVSQGNETINTDGSVMFKPDYPLPKIALLIGEYEKHSIVVDSIEYSVFSIKGNDYYSGLFTDAIDTIPDLVRDLKKEYEANIRMKYPFNKMVFAEVPLHFAVDNHIYSYSSDAVQPEIFFCPEKGVLFSSSDFKGRKIRLEKDLKNNNEEVLPIAVQSDLFKQFFRENFLAKRGQRFNYDQIVDWQTFSILPQYVSFYTRLDSKEWPVLSIALETYISERNNPMSTTIQWYEDLSTDEKINLELQNASLEKILSEGITSEGGEERNPVTVSDIVQVKGLSLFNLMSSRLGSASLDTLINGTIREYAHKPIPFDVFSEKFTRLLGINFSEEVDLWYRQSKLPGFLIKDMDTYKVTINEATRYQVKFQVSNPEDVDGIVTLNVEFNDPNRQRDFWDPGFSVDFTDKLYLPAHSSFEAGYAFSSEPARLSIQTHISRNLPNNLIYNFSGFTDTRNVPVLDSIQPVKFFDRTTGEKEFIADNEDDIFDYKQAMSQAYLKSLVDRKKSSKYKYSAIWWNPPREWKAVLRSEFFGHYVRSSYYTKGGAGERTATWKTVLPAEGSYDVYFHVNKVNMWSRNNRASDYNLSIYHDQGVDKINHATENTDPGWHYIGTWYISSDTARVDLSNKSNGASVYADAVKWVLNK